MGLSPLRAGHGRVLKDTNPDRPPRGFRHASPCPRVDRPVPGRVRVTPRACTRRPSPPKRLRPCRFPYAFPDAPVRLATRTHSLVRFSKRTTEHRLPTGPTTGLPPSRSRTGLSCPVAPSPTDFRPSFTPLVRGAFQRSLTLLVRYRSRVVLSLGRRCRPHSRGISNPRYSGADTRRTSPRYGAFTLYRAPFQETSRGRSGDDRQSEHHIARRLRFGLRRVHSPLLTASRSVSLPAGTEMFQFPAFPIARSNCGGDSHSEILGSSPPCGSPRLIAAWHVLHRRPSRAIHQLA